MCKRIYYMDYPFLQYGLFILTMYILNKVHCYCFRDEEKLDDETKGFIK